MDGGWADLGLWRVDRAEAAPLFRQVYLQVRAAILARTLTPGARLPASRELARRLGVSRTSVVSAYEQLLAEGWLSGRVGAGTFVARDLPQPFAAPEPPRPDQGAYVQDRTDAFGPLVLAEGADEDAPFTMGRSLMDARATAAWRQATQRCGRSFDPRHLGYADPRGFIELRVAICDYLRAARAVRCDPDQVIVTSGAQQAIDIAGRALLKPGDEVWVEDPTYPTTYRGLAMSGFRPVPVPVDEEGLRVSEGIGRSPDARAVVATPSHQYPTGAVLSLTRRLELLAWAREAGAWIIEDDYDSELRYRGRPLASLQGLDEAGRVIYVGTLNKALFPGLRVGYLVVPRTVLEAFVNARRLTDRQPATLVQPVLARFMAEGHLAANFRRMRTLYRQAQDVLIETLEAGVGPGRLRFGSPDQGNHLVAWLPDGSDDRTIEAEALRRGVVCRAISRLYLEARPRPGLLLGFTGYAPEVVAAAAATTARVIAEALDG